MTSFDYTVIAIMLVSMMLGFWRGLIYEVMSLLGWPLAFMLSRKFAANLELLLPVDQEMARVSLAYVLVFVVALIAWAVLVWMFSKIIKAVGLGVIDSVLGGFFGLFRGIMVILVLVWLAGVTPVPEQAFWRNAKLSLTIEQGAQYAKMMLPDNISQRIHYRN